MVDVVIAGGGTGGHTSPGLAVAALLRQRHLTCAWIGSRHGVEARIVPERDVPYTAIPTGKLRRYWSWHNVADLLVNTPTGVLAATHALSRLQPRVVFATGGYVALPVVLAAAIRRVPSVIHEQTAVPGLANRLAGRLASRIAVTFPDADGRFPRSRADAISMFELDSALPVVYITGGAQGAQRINRAVGEALPALLAEAQVIH